MILSCTGLAALTYTSYLLSAATIAWSLVVPLGAASVVVLGVAAWHLLRARAPLVNLRTLRVPTFGAAVGGGSMFWATVSAVPFLLTLLFQNRFGWSPVKSGAVVLFVFIGNIAIKPATTPLLRRFGFRRVLLVATSGAAATMVAAALFTSATPLALIAAVSLLSGVGRSTGLTCYSTIGFSDVPPDQLSDANTLQATAQQLAVGLGVPLAAVALRAGGVLRHLLPGDVYGQDPYAAAFLLLAMITLGATAAAVRLRPEAGASVTAARTAEPVVTD